MACPDREKKQQSLRSRLRLTNAMLISDRQAQKSMEDCSKQTDPGDRQKGGGEKGLSDINLTGIRITS